MKYIGLFFTITLLSIGTVFADTEEEVIADEICEQVVQPAVGPNGRCVDFPTPCDVPERWKTVPSCDNIKQTSRTSLEERNRRTAANRRGLPWFRTGGLLNETEEDGLEMIDKTFATRRGATTKGKEFYSRLARKSRISSDEYRKRRLSTMPKYDSRSAVKLFKRQTPSKGGLKTDLTAGQKRQMRIDITGKRRPAVRSSVSRDLKRLDTPLDPKTFNKEGIRTVKTQNYGRNPYWRSASSLIKDAQLEKKRARRVKRVARMGQAKGQVYRGDIEERREVYSGDFLPDSQ